MNYESINKLFHSDETNVIFLVPKSTFFFNYVFVNHKRRTHLAEDLFPSFKKKKNRFSSY